MNRKSGFIDVWLAIALLVILITGGFVIFRMVNGPNSSPATTDTSSHEEDILVPTDSKAQFDSSIYTLSKAKISYPSQWDITSDSNESYFQINSPDHERTEITGQSYLTNGGEISLRVYSSNLDSALCTTNSPFKRSQVESKSIGAIDYDHCVFGHNNPSDVYEALIDEALFQFVYTQPEQDIDLYMTITETDEYGNEFRTVIESLQLE